MLLPCISALWIAGVIILARRLQHLLASTADTRASLGRLKSVLRLMKVQHWRAWRQRQAPWWTILGVGQDASLPEIEHAYQQHRDKAGNRPMLSIALLEGRSFHARLRRQHTRSRLARHRRSP